MSLPFWLIVKIWWPFLVFFLRCWWIVCFSHVPILVFFLFIIIAFLSFSFFSCSLVLLFFPLHSSHRRTETKARKRTGTEKRKISFSLALALSLSLYIYIFGQNWLTHTMLGDRAKLSESSICEEVWIQNRETSISSFFPSLSTFFLLLLVWGNVINVFCLHAHLLSSRKLYFNPNTAPWLTFVGRHLSRTTKLSALIMRRLARKQHRRSFRPSSWVLRRIDFVL